MTARGLPAKRVFVKTSSVTKLTESILPIGFCFGRLGFDVFQSVQFLFFPGFYGVCSTLMAMVMRIDVEKCHFGSERVGIASAVWTTPSRRHRDVWVWRGLVMGADLYALNPKYV